MSGFRAGAGVAGAAGASLPYTGMAFGLYVALAVALVLAGIAVRVVARARA